jgi:hypothetical protein
VFFGAFLVDLRTQGGGTSGAKDGLTITAILAAVGSAAGIFHVGRTQVTSALGDIWGMVESPMVEAELVESIALSTRRLPSDTVGGASPPQTKTMKDRLQRARQGSLPAAASSGSKRRPPPILVGGQTSAAGLAPALGVTGHRPDGNTTANPQHPPRGLHPILRWRYVTGRR